MSWVEIFGLLGDFIGTSLGEVLSSDTEICEKTVIVRRNSRPGKGLEFRSCPSE